MNNQVSGDYEFDDSRVAQRDGRRVVFARHDRSEEIIVISFSLDFKLLEK